LRNIQDPYYNVIWFCLVSKTSGCCDIWEDGINQNDNEHNDDTQNDIRQNDNKYNDICQKDNHQNNIVRMTISRMTSFVRMLVIRMTFVRMMISRMTFVIIVMVRMTFNRMTISITTFIRMTHHDDTRQNGASWFRYFSAVIKCSAECYFPECHGTKLLLCNYSQMFQVSNQPNQKLKKRQLETLL